MLNPAELKKIDLYMEDHYSNSVKIGGELLKAGLNSSQIRGLESVIFSTSRYSEIINHIKFLAGKDQQNKWIKVAPLLLTELKQLEDTAIKIGNNNPELILDIKLKLARIWIKQIIPHYYIGSKFFGDPTINNPSIKVFINYAKEDWVTAKRIYDDLRRTPISPWIDVEDLIPGQNWRKAIEETISSTKLI